MSALSPQHEAELNSSRIDTGLIAGRGYRTVDADWRDKLSAMGCPAWAMSSDDAFPGLVLPMYEPKTGQFIGFQFKPANPQVKPGTDKTAKYASPSGMGNRLDVHPQCVDRVADVSRPLWITEGIKKGDALASRDLAVVTLTGVWNWRSTEGTLAEWEDIPLKGRTVIVCFDADAGLNPSVRNAMMRLVGWLRKKTKDAGNDGKVFYLAVPDKVGDTAVKGVDDYLAAGGDLAALRSYASEKAPELPSSKDAAFSDAFLTDTVCAEALSGSFVFARGLGWMRYDGVKWASTGEALIVEEIRRWAIGHWDEVVEEYKADQSRDVKARMDGWRQILTKGRLTALASLAKGPLHAEATEFDAHPDLLNTPSGVVDLRTGELLEADPAYRFTKVTGVPYDPAATDPDFEQALTALPEDVRDWYQVRIGQAFTGHMPPDDVMLVQQGGGENGKSTLAVPIKRAIGSYSVLVSDRVILGRPDQHPTELMDLMGARYALMEETPEARQLNVQQLKKVVGTPQVTARRIAQDPVTFDASHSLFVNTNFPPAVAESDHATWRRLALVRFPYTFRAKPEDVAGQDDRLGDPALRERCMTTNGPAVAALTWAVRGAVRWYQAKKVLGPHPDRVVADTEEWRRKGDLILNFAEECLEFGPEHTATTQDMYQAFSEWLPTQGHKPWSLKLLSERMNSHDLLLRRGLYYKRHRVEGSQDKVRQWVGARVVRRDQGQSVSPGSNPFSS